MQPLQTPNRWDDHHNVVNPLMFFPQPVPQPQVVMYPRQTISPQHYYPQHMHHPQQYSSHHPLPSTFQVPQPRVQARAQHGLPQMALASSQSLLQGYHHPRPRVVRRMRPQTKAPPRPGLQQTTCLGILNEPTEKELNQALQLQNAIERARQRRYS